MKLFPLDPHAPPREEKKHPSLPWQCQMMCHGECCSGEGECPPDRLSPNPSMRPDREQRYA